MVDLMKRSGDDLFLGHDALAIPSRAGDRENFGEVVGRGRKSGRSARDGRTMTVTPDAVSLDLAADVALPALTATAARVLLQILTETRRDSDTTTTPAGLIDATSRPGSPAVEAEFTPSGTKNVDDPTPLTRQIAAPNDRDRSRRGRVQAPPTARRREDPAA